MALSAPQLEIMRKLKLTEKLNPKPKPVKTDSKPKSNPAKPSY